MTFGNLWTEEELQYMTPEFTVREVTDLTGRSQKAVYKKAEALGIRLKKSPNGFEQYNRRALHEKQFIDAKPGPSARSEYGYTPKSQHPDWTKVKFS